MLEEVLDASGHDAAELAGEYHSGSAQKALDKLLELVTLWEGYVLCQLMICVDLELNL